MAQSYRYLLGLLAALTLGACSEDPTVCKLADNATSSVAVDYGKAVELAPKLCGVKKPEEVSYTWALDGQAAGNAPSYRFLACPRFKGHTTPVKVNVSYGGKTAHHTWDVAVRDVEPDYPSCSATLTPKDAIAALQRGDFFGSEKGVDFKTAVACIDRALVEYPCDVDLAFWAAYGDLMTFAQSLATSLAVSGVNERTLNAVVDERIDPLIARFDLLAAETPNDFEARPKDFEFSLLSLEIHPGGEWDRGDILVLDAAFHLAKGGAKFLSAYIGSLQAIQTVGLGGLQLFGPAGFAKVSPAIQNKLIDLLDEDPSFLALYPKEGPERLEAAQNSLITGLRQLNAAISFVKAEKDDQRDDMFRYFDCGVDAVCPPEDSRNPIKGDAGERLVKDEPPLGVYNSNTDAFIDANGNGRYDPAWTKVGPDKGEGDLQYSEGETIGTDVFDGFLGRIGVPITPLMQNLISDLATNIEGPDALDLTKFVTGAQDAVLQAAVVGGLNIPSLRLSRWFEGPRDLRDFLPLWSHSQRLFFVDSEEEPYEDWGYDHTPSYAEPATITVTCKPLASPPANDPRGDDFNPQTNPGDGCDNDEDGVIDNVDPVTGRSRDLGVEGNARFDFKDTNLNGKHDVGEPAELFYDTGLLTFGKAPLGAGNGRWDAVDMIHYWPKGDDVGGRDVTIKSDPKNGALQDITRELIDPMYYFFPDAQFNGVLIFENPTTNIDGYTLSDNAELMRFLGKLVAASRGLVD